MVKSASGVFIQPVHDAAGYGVAQWRRVYGAVRSAIDGGALVAGVRLPSARQLAADWRVSRGAVDEAFAQLQLEGLIERRVGDGTYVNALPPALRRQPKPVAQRVLQRSAVLGCAPARLEAAWTTMRVPPLHPRSTDIDAFPLELWRRLMVQACDEAQRSLLDGVPPGGLTALREAITRHLAIHRGVRCAPEQVLVINGPGEGVQVVARLLLSAGDTVWIEDPSHPSLPLLMRTLGLNVVGVPLDTCGFDVEAGQRLAPDAKLVYLHPLMQYPLGQVTHNRRAEQLLAWARRSGAWIIEGHFNDETVPPAQQLPALASNDASGRVILMGTFEGVMFPSLRVAYLVLPRALAPAFIGAATGLGERVPAAVQWALAEFIDRGHMTTHLQAQRAALFRRRDTVRALLLATLPAGVRAGPMNAGTHLCLHLPASVADTELASALRKQRVMVEPLSAIAWQAKGLNGLVIGYGAWDGAVLENALRCIAQTLAAACAAYQPSGENA